MACYAHTYIIQIMSKTCRMAAYCMNLSEFRIEMAGSFIFSHSIYFSTEVRTEDKSNVCRLESFTSGYSRYLLVTSVYFTC